MPRSLIIATLLLALSTLCAAQEPTELRLPVAAYRDHMAGGWLGQIIGVSWGAPTEFKWSGSIIPADQMPAWTENMVNNAFGQDDLYVEMTFLRTLELYRFDASPHQAGIDFANTRFSLWCANRAGRENLRRGIAPPDSGHPHFSRNSDDIDYQIEADYSGLIAPGLPNTVLTLGDLFGRIMNYGDGLYAGQFMGALYAYSFFETDMEKLINLALQCIPAESQYAGMVRDVLQWYHASPDEWEKTWAKINDRYFKDPAFHRYAGGGIDAKTNGACVLTGLLYGGKDLERTVQIACRCGWDSDCNPSSAGGVLGAMLGQAQIPDRFKARLDHTRKFAYTAYNFDDILAVCEKLAREAVTRAGGRIETDADGAENFVIPVKKPAPGPLERSWEAGPIADSRFTPQERAQIELEDELTRGIRAVAPGWELADCGSDMGAPMLLNDFRGRKNVLITHPLDRNTPDVLRRKIAVPTGNTTTLHLTVSHFPQGDWVLQVKADGELLKEQLVGPTTVKDGWLDLDVDLTPLAGREVTLELLNVPNGWAWEAAYWAHVSLESH
jgi:hypothetical protein